MATLIGNEVPSTVDNTTQVYKATHEGTNRLSLRDRSFISFTYGGRAIEDFNVIATMQNRLQRAMYGAFEDITTHYDVLDGQFYWGSYFTNNTLEFNLTTDAISEKELADFKNWFRPGVIRELILAENPNRAIWARIAAAPVMSLVPMEKQVTRKIGGESYSTSTTSYRGDIGLSFVMDDPFWHSRFSMIKKYYTDPEDKFGSMTDDEVEGATSTLGDKDFIKVIIEDGTPHESMKTSERIILGNEEEDFTFSDQQPAYLYYCGTSTGRPTIKIIMNPAIENNYIAYPRNTYSADATMIDDTPTYNIITIGDREFRFTAPALYIGYNQAIKIVKNFLVGEAAEDVRTALRDNVFEYHSRNWALFCLESMIQHNLCISAEGALEYGFFAQFSDFMRYLIMTTDPESENPDELHTLPLRITINSRTGKAVGRLEFRVPNVLRVAETTKDTEGNDVVIDYLPQNQEQFLTQSAVILEENVEDMIRSDYILIENRNFPDEEGNITEEVCSKIVTDYPEDVCGPMFCNIQYENEYL